MTSPIVSVLMPTYAQEHFIRRTVDSLLAQKFTDWELLIIDDASPGDVRAALGELMADARIHYHRMETNSGRGRALNTGLGIAQGRYIAYLPSDDVYHTGHLESLVQALDRDPSAVLAYSGVRHHYNRTALGQIEGYSLQLVQVMHRTTGDRWTERETLVSDDLHLLYWSRLEPHGDFIGTQQVTCEWVDHPVQLHKLIREPEGGINTYRSHFGIAHPLRFKTMVGNAIDEVAHYRRFRERPDTPTRRDGLKIVLVGELAYNAERVLALEERGHKLYGLWMKHPYWYNTVGPVPFGHVEDIPYENWQESLKRIQPDIIYGLLNWQAVPFAHEILKGRGDIPFVWHFKEGPFICLEKGTWPQLIELYAKSDGQIYTSPEMCEWFQDFLPPDVSHTLILDGDLPKREWFTDERQPRLSERDGEIHTVVPGRPIGLHPHSVETLARHKIHLHFYGDFTHGQWRGWIDKTLRMAPGYLHLHAQVDQSEWVREFSQYDAGWLHLFQSENHGELRRANWDDLNYPARMSTLAAAGLPMLQLENAGHIVATQRLAKQLDIGVFFDSLDALGHPLNDHAYMQTLRDNVWRVREQFTFDHHADRLIDFFRSVINSKLAKAYPHLRSSAD